MISILIVDDEPNKIRDIKSVLLEIADIQEEYIVIAADVFNAKKELLQSQFDLMILDLSLPQRFGDLPEQQGGANFLEEIILDDTYIHPFHIIGVTAYEELKSSFTDSFANYLWHIIYYEPEYKRWKDQLVNYVAYLIKSKAEINNPNNIRPKFDIGIITALTKIELENILKLDANWKEFYLNNDHTIYYKGIFSDGPKRLTVVAASANQMGMTASGLISQKIIHNFRPRYLIIAGIAAGIKGKGELGDIMIADLSWDYGSGKISSNKGKLIFKQDPRPIQLHPELKAIVQNEEIKNSFCQIIKDKWKILNGEDFGKPLKMIYGPIASGSYVIENIKKIQEVVDQQRKLIGIDMETYAVFFTSINSSNPKPIPMAIKSVCDYGDEEKNDKFQNYAAFTSANYIYYFSLKYFE